MGTSLEYYTEQLEKRSNRTLEIMIPLERVSKSTNPKNTKKISADGAKRRQEPMQNSLEKTNRRRCANRFEQRCSGAEMGAPTPIGPPAEQIVTKKSIE